MSFVFKTMPSPVGPLTLVASATGLAGILWQHDKPARTPHLTLHRQDEAHEMLCITEQQLNEYFAGTRTSFTLPLDFKGTAFQQRVWRALLTIPYGETRTYSQIAQQLGNPLSVRAVGAANGKNPISIIAPCHRVLGANGTLTGFAGGLQAKAYLLNMESRVSLKAS